ncbi:uncharacterized protein EI90DRAFT_3011142 [Cantharellus anzutake]|uniref:uncharacterized protein n=1 Tax=Cantharellus anzutake TaxID=1750568 RepID=UPI00190327EF|nr:uncharacterized protein EI90DRAFT_3011142 [Cantharellus anzutake]KAF8342624.1 hypothetical protein EI90DRAFT_3011142 [Cantharellus anzutake]
MEGPDLSNVFRVPQPGLKAADIAVSLRRVVDLPRLHVAYACGISAWCGTRIESRTRDLIRVTPTPREKKTWSADKSSVSRADSLVVVEEEENLMKVDGFFDVGDGDDDGDGGYGGRFETLKSKRDRSMLGVVGSGSGDSGLSILEKREKRGGGGGGCGARVGMFLRGSGIGHIIDCERSKNAVHSRTIYARLTIHGPTTKPGSIPLFA